MKNTLIVLMSFGTFWGSSLHASTDSRSSIQQYVDTTESVLIGTVADRGTELKSELVLTDTYSISKNGYRSMPEAISLNNARSSIVLEQRRPEEPGGSKNVLQEVTKMNASLPNFSTNTKYLIMVDKLGNYTAGSTFIINPDDTVMTMSGTPIVVDEHTRELRRTNFDYDLSGVTDLLLKDSEGGTDRVIYYSRAKVVNEERPSPLNEVLDAITESLSSK